MFWKNVVVRSVLSAVVCNLEKSVEKCFSLDVLSRSSTAKSFSFGSVAVAESISSSFKTNFGVPIKMW